MDPREVASDAPIPETRSTSDAAAVARQATAAVGGPTNGASSPPTPARPEPMPPAMARAETAAVTTPPSPLPPLEGGRSMKKAIVGIVVVALVAGGIFTFSSERNTRLVTRKLREAFLGRNPGGALTIESIPPGALVTLDDEETGRKTPLTIENLESERIHTIELDVPGEKTETTTVTINAGQKKSITMVFEGLMVNFDVKSVPEGAEVWVDGTNRAFSPTSMSIPAGKEIALKLKKLGYVDFEQSYTPKRGEPIKVDVTLEKTPELIEQEAQEAAALKALEREKSPKKKRRRKRR